MLVCAAACLCARCSLLPWCAHTFVCAPPVCVVLCGALMCAALWCTGHVCELLVRVWPPWFMPRVSELLKCVHMCAPCMCVSCMCVRCISCELLVCARVCSSSAVHTDQVWLYQIRSNLVVRTLSDLCALVCCALLCSAVLCRAAPRSAMCLLCC